MKTLIQIVVFLLLNHLLLTGQSEMVIEDIDNNGINFLRMNTQNPAPSNIYLYSDGIGKKATIGTTESGHPITFQTNDGEKMRITDTGRIGVGTGSPSEAVHIAGRGGGNTVLRLSHDDSTAPIGSAQREIGIELFSDESSASISSQDWRIMNRFTGLEIERALDETNFERIVRFGKSGSNIFSFFTSNIGIHRFPSRALDVLEETDDLLARFTQASQGAVGIELIRQQGNNNTTNRDWQIVNDDVGIFRIGDSSNGTNFTTQFRLTPSVASVDADFRPLQDDRFDLGSAAERWDNVFATNPLIVTSDIREKKEIRGINYGLETINKLNPVSYYWKDGDTDKKLGLIAQEVLEVVPEVVNVPEEEGGLYGMSYSELVPVLIQSIQELSDKVDSQSKLILELQLNKGK